MRYDLDAPGDFIERSNEFGRESQWWCDAIVSVGGKVADGAKLLMVA